MNHHLQGTKYDFLKKKQIFERQREAAAQKGSDFISFGIELSSHDKRKNEQTLCGHDASKQKLKIVGA